MAKNFDSEYEIQQNILIKLGGDGTKCFDSLYSILLEILDKIEGGGGSGAQIDDDHISTTTAWSSSKIVSELDEKADISYVDTNFAKLSILTQAQYDALATKDASTLYIISDAQ